MKASQSVVFASLVSSVLLTLAAPAFAALRGGSYSHSALANGIVGDRNQIRQERGQLDEDRRNRHLDREELREDRHDGASHGEIAGDRRNIRRDGHDVNEDRLELRADRRDLRRDLHEEHHSYWDGWHSWWNRR